MMMSFMHALHLNPRSQSADVKRVLREKHMRQFVAHVDRARLTKQIWLLCILRASCFGDTL